MHSLREFDQLYKEQYKPLFSVAMKMLSDDVVAHDILQEVFSSFLEISRKRDKIESPRSYLLRATLNKCIDHTKSERRLQRFNGHEHQLQHLVEDKMDEKEVVKIALSAMTETDRKLLVLYSEGYSYKEISAMLEIKFSSVGKTLSRALSKMKDELKILDHEMSW